MSTDSTLPRRALVGSAWATPVVLVGAAAPAFAASTGTISATFRAVRLSDGLTFAGTVTNGGQSAAVVTALIRIDLLTPTNSYVPSGDLQTVPGWTWTRYVWPNYPDQSSVEWEGYTTAPLAAGASIAVPDPTVQLDPAATTAGTAQLTLSAPSPAVVVQPAPVTFAGYAVAPQAKAGKSTASSAKRRNAITPPA